MNEVKKELYTQIKNILESARNNAYRTINSVMVRAYWNVGRIIVEEEQKGKNRAKYGKFLIKSLSVKLTEDFGKGFDERNLRYIRRFYQTFPKWNAVRSELSWTHYRLLIRVKNQQARDFYIEESISENWSTRALERQINSFYYERILSSKKKKAVIKEAENNTKRLISKPEDIIKDPTILEFLNIKQETDYLEKDLQRALINKLQDFLLELGKGFSFVARQKRISTETSHFYIDLVFYNYILKCFILIDLKTGKLTHQDIGQMDMYVRLFEDQLKLNDDNPTIGIILCSQKDETIVKYSVLKENKQIFASKHQMYLPTEEELKKEIEREINLIEIEKQLGKV